MTAWLRIFLFLILPTLAHAEPPQPVQATVVAYFSPRGGAEAAIVQALSQARSSVCVLAYSYTSAPIAAALIEAHGRGVAVEVIVDKGQPTAKGGKAKETAAAGIPVLVDRAHAIAHNKVMVIDEARVITGSFNFTAGAEARNAENMLVLDAADLAQAYLDDFARHKAHSAPLQ